jgi:dipeptidyl aminopeptidase/acylaminoacyl peptidase
VAVVRSLGPCLLLALAGGPDVARAEAQAASKAEATRSLSSARRGFSSKLRPSPLPPEHFEPAAAPFRDVKFPSAVGELHAYVTPDPGDGKKHAAIVWVTGGDCNSIGQVWRAAPADNDQTAAAYRRAGLVLMFPSLRGGNDNPGRREGFLGEVDDVIAAHAWLAKQPYVDPRRIYLGGHSTGGTLVLLVAESFEGFQGVFSFGPVADVRGYGEDSGLLPYDVSDPLESRLRSPGYWLDGIRTPTWVIEGDGRGNVDQLRAMRRVARTPTVTWAEIHGASHFSVLAPLNAFIAQRLLAAAPGAAPALTAAELDQAFAAVRPAAR